MSLDFELVDDGLTVFEANITHNLAEMAKQVGLYDPLWKATEIGDKAESLIPRLGLGLCLLLESPEECMKYNPPNDWGNYDDLINFTKEVYLACLEHPEAQISISV